MHSAGRSNNLLKIYSAWCSMIVTLLCLVLSPVAETAAWGFEEATGSDQTPSAIYGDDNRHEPWEVTHLPYINETVRATAMFVRRSDVAKLSVSDPSEPARCRLIGRTFSQRFSLCPGERFGLQPAPAYCSGVLVGSDTLVTAGHCMRTPTDCASTAVVFDFVMAEGSVTRDLTVPASSVYVCSSIVARAHDPDSGLDFAVIRLNRPAEGRVPVPMRLEGKVKDDAVLAAVGYQSGLPVKVSTQGRVRSSHRPAYFTATLDVTDGSSGSPVINMETGLLEGIIVRGQSAFDWNVTCFQTKFCDEQSCRGEDVTRTTQFLQYIP